MVSVSLGVDVVKLGFPTLPETKPEGDALNDEQTLRDLHRLLLETHVTEGKLICENCGHEYRIKDGIANFLLPSHLGLFRVFCFDFYTDVGSLNGRIILGDMKIGIWNSIKSY